MKPLEQAFYLQDGLVVAKALLGKILVREIDQKAYPFKIVETEAYRGPEDKGAHTYGGIPTPRTKPIFKAGGITYIYLIYGMYNCLNLVAGDEGIPHAVLIRAIEPIGEESECFAKINRPIQSKKRIELTNGPGKLCKALQIDRSLNETAVTQKGAIWVADAPPITERVADKRINIPYAEEYAEVEWRFYIKDNPFVSVLKKD
ncbi:3-methyladenine DNA glycosylase [Sporanaerobium hydrogeniformans]|uniref:3-methyladenine DNA glycosylase n=1 Tax=Sporanaerobium hydrogeniformans TaxID=3072179 RepID=A0AC61D9E6_9FIRM|nr:DNA-3-methyladenine glycosylase [Sporanaerobium hydrogeniformans]PHV69870.1 3-methyladenine DNA glycosylase [Sporanaerobium hydrogeniformans]